MYCVLFEKEPSALPDTMSAQKSLCLSGSNPIASSSEFVRPSPSLSSSITIDKRAVGITPPNHDSTSVIHQPTPCSYIAYLSVPSTGRPATEVGKKYPMCGLSFASSSIATGRYVGSIEAPLPSTLIICQLLPSHLAYLKA